MEGQTRAPAAVIKMSVKSSKGIVGERGQKHLLKWQSFPPGSVVHIRFYISVRTHIKRTFSSYTH